MNAVDLGVGGGRKGTQGRRGRGEGRERQGEAIGGKNTGRLAQYAAVQRPAKSAPHPHQQWQHVNGCTISSPVPPPPTLSGQVATLPPCPCPPFTTHWAGVYRLLQLLIRIHACVVCACACVSVCVCLLVGEGEVTMPQAQAVLVARHRPWSERGGAPLLSAGSNRRGGQASHGLQAACIRMHGRMNGRRAA